MNKEMLKELLSELLDGKTDKLGEMVRDRFIEASESDFEISIKGKKGETHCELKGEKLAILIGLAGLEKNVLSKLEVPAGTWEIVKKLVDTEEVK